MIRPTAARTSRPRPCSPELGQSWEGGVKAKLFAGLTVSAAGFYIVKENATEYLPIP